MGTREGVESDINKDGNKTTLDDTRMGNAEANEDDDIE
jgi:hypothetical protein